MNEDHRKKIKKIIGGMKCPKDFQCADSGFDNLYKTEVYRLQGFLIGLDWAEKH